VPEQHTRQQIEADVDLVAQRLGNAEDDATDQRAPQRAQPPMTTASKPNSRIDGPSAGPNVWRIPMNTPASATVAKAMAMARA
jgi:hypothetical protein